MILFIYGEDAYRSKEKLDNIIDQYKKIHKSGLNFKSFDLQKHTFSDFQESFQTKSMFKEKKLLVLKNAFSNREFQEKFLARTKNFLISEEVILFYEAQKVSPQDKLFKFLKKNAKWQSFDLLKGKKLEIWIKNRLKNYDREIEPSALHKIIEYAGNDLSRLTNEIKKLVCFRKEVIKSKDVELLVKPNIETEIFKTIDAFAGGNKKVALILIKKHLEKGENPLYLFSMLNYQFRNLLVIKDLLDKRQNYNEISQKTGLHPYVIRKSLPQLKNFSFLKLKQLYELMFEIDRRIKTGGMTSETGLILFLSKT